MPSYDADKDCGRMNYYLLKRGKMSGKNIEPYSREVFYYETDRMGIVHHSNYIRMMEETRVYYMEKLGMPYDKMEEDGIIIPVISAEAKYKISLTYGNRVFISMRLTQFNGVKFRCEYEIKNEKGQLCAVGATEHCFLDTDMKLFNFRRAFPDYYDIFLNSVEKG